MDVEVVGLLKALPTHGALKVQIGLCLVFGHVVFQGGPLAALETTHLAPGEREREVNAQSYPGSLLC